jgi:hypothetical protein
MLLSWLSSAWSSKARSAVRRFLIVESLEERCLLSGDVVLTWNAIALDALKNDSYLGANQKQAGPDRASRALAIEQAAVFDAVNSIDRSYDPYLIEVDAPRNASIKAAAAQAAHDTLIALFPDYQTTLDARLAADLASVHSVRSRDDGALVGHIVAESLLAARSHDGSDAPMTYTPGNQPGDWQPDPLHPSQMPHGPLWGNVTPFALESAEQFHAPPPPSLTSQEYTDAFNEVKSLGGDGVTTPTVRTAEQTEIGIFWAYDGSPGLGTPPRLYNQIAAVLAVQEHNTVVENARFFALVNLAMADAGIACWDAKYDFSFWRPVTGIRAAGIDGNPDTTADPNWMPLGAPADNGSGTNFTPAFPAYASGHATFGGTLFQMMANFFGRNDISFTIGSDEFNGVTRDQNGVVRPVVTRSFTSFSQAAEENGQSRIYLGIHWKFDKVQGITMGDNISDYIFNHFMRPSHGHQDNQDGEGRRHDSVVNADRKLAYAQAVISEDLAPKGVGVPHQEQVTVGYSSGVSEELPPVHSTVKSETIHFKSRYEGNAVRDTNRVLELPNWLLLGEANSDIERV